MQRLVTTMNFISTPKETPNLKLIVQPISGPENEGDLRQQKIVLPFHPTSPDHAVARSAASSPQCRADSRTVPTRLWRVRLDGLCHCVKLADIRR
jgi:hypothetical protein